MKTLLKISLLTLGLAAMTFPAVHAVAADDTTAPAGKHPRLRAFLKQRAMIRAAVARRLGLSKDQISQLKADRAKTISELKALRADQTLTREQKKAKAREILQATRTEMRGVLTADQQAKLDQLKEKRRAGKPGRG